MGIHFNSFNFGNSYNQYATMPVRKIEAAEQKEVVSEKPQEVNESIAPVEEQPKESAPIRKANAPLEDLAISFHKKSSIEELGQNSDIGNVDIQKAISDMKKDQILKQYQFFVPPTEDVLNNQDGKVIAK